MGKKTEIVIDDPWLEPYSHIITARNKSAIKLKEKLLKQHQNLKKFASGHIYYGMHKNLEGWTFREHAPNAIEIYLVGDFNNWQKHDTYKLQYINCGNWELKVSEEKIREGDKYKLILKWEHGEGERLPSYATYCIQDEKTKLFNAVVYSSAFKWQHKLPVKKNTHPLIYEAHIGMATEEEKVGTFNEFRTNILPKIKEAGYNTLQLMAIQEHPYYASFGYHVSNFFAISSRFGTPDDLRKLIDQAHKSGIAVIMDLVHSHSVKNEIEGLALFDGTPDLYFHKDPRREHIAWDSLCFDYGKLQVLHFLLSNCRYWLEEFNFDGFRFDGVTSMLYLDHGLERNFSSYESYYDGNQDTDAMNYLILANMLIHEINPNAITIAEEMSGMPGLAESIEHGGYGFDYRLAMGIPDYWIKIIKEKSDDEWNISEMYHELTTRRKNEKTINYCESHDQALVGDKTIIFRLIDKEMYWHMNVGSENLIVDRGIALHKMIRLITFATSGGGYLNFMGNEFGHPEWIDFPRKGNDWSFKFARRQWALKTNNDLRYSQLNEFDKAVLTLQQQFNFMKDPWTYLLLDNPGDKVLVFCRGNLLFVFNFNPNNSYTNYGFKTRAGKYRIVLNSDSYEFGGFGNIDNSVLYFTERLGGVDGDDWLKVYIPLRTAIVLERLNTPSVYDM